MSTLRMNPAAIAPGAPFQERKPVKGSVVWWLRFLGIAAFIILLLRLPSTEKIQLERIDLRWLGFCMLLAILQLLLDAGVWQWMLSAQRIRHPYPKTLLAHLASQYLGLVTPGHVGEFLAAGYISMHTGITFGYALSSVVMKKLVNWTVLVGFGTWGLVEVWRSGLLARVLLVEIPIPLKYGVQRIALTSILVVVTLAVGIGLWVLSVRWLGRKWRNLSPWQVDMAEFWSGFRHLRSPGLVVPLVISAVGFSLLFFQLAAVLRSLGVELPIMLIAPIVAFSRIVARVFPISVVGWGSKDAAVIGLLSQQGIDPAVGLAATLLLLLCSYFLTLLLSAVSWWIRPLLIRRARTTNW